MTRAERRREEREYRLAPVRDPKVPKLRRVTWEVPTDMAARVRDVARDHGISVNQMAEILLGAGLTAYDEERRRQAEEHSLVKLATSMPPRKSMGALLGGR